MDYREPATDSIAELRELIDTQEASFDPHHKPVPESWPRELLEGTYGSARNRVWCDDTERILAWGSMQPDEHRKRIEVELYRVPSFVDTDIVWQWCRDVGDRDYPGWEMWITINRRDAEMSRLLNSTGYDVLRRFYLLSRSLAVEAYPELPPGLSVSVMNGEADLRAWHAAHQDAFSTHFGFSPRPYEQWIESTMRPDTADPEGQFLLRLGEEVVGFVVCTHENIELGEGFIQLLGVTHAFQHRGYGELLLRWALAYCGERGFTAVDLYVDTANTSGALALYERLGLTTVSEYHLYAEVDSQAGASNTDLAPGRG